MKSNDYIAIFIAAACCLFAQNSSAQNILDPNFADAIRAECPTCIDISNNLTLAAQNLDSIDVSHSNISNLAGIEGFTSLQILNCNFNQLDSLPALPASLTSLDCRVNQLSSLPALPAGLTVLECSFNQLDSLPTLPAGLTYLNCRVNQLDSLPALPASLTELYCSENQLDSLPALPFNLMWLTCYDNQLGSLPALPASLIVLDCGGNQLDSLPVLPASLIYLDCQDNPSLFCLPFLPNGLEYLVTSGTQITCIPYLPPNLNTSLPLCSEPCNSSVSTSNIYATRPFSLQPNPVSDILQVRFSADYEAKTDLRLLNFNGQVVRALSGNSDLTIPMGDLPEGIYWLEVRGMGWFFGEKILKQ